MTCAILLIDDHATIRETLTEVLANSGHNVSTAENQAAALKQLETQPFDLVLTDLKLPDGSGMEILAHSKKLYPATPVVMITGHGSIDNAVEATRRGAFDYLTKPVDLNKLRLTVRNALHLMELERHVEQSSALDALIGQSSGIMKVKEFIKQVAHSDATVLIEGESGTGKELVANALQAQSPRSRQAFIKVNVAALPRELVESELFGHEKGAFSGAIRQRKGRFELADHGTLFLDEISEMPLGLQVKLLRVLQEREFERVGGDVTLPLDIRLICATNSDLRKLIEQQKFREDLYFRINVLRVKIPPLRDRREDIELLALHFLQKFNARYHSEKEWSPEFLARLSEYSWPGNVREMENLLEGAFVRAVDSSIDAKFLPPEIYGGLARGETLRSGDEKNFPSGLTMAEIEKRYILSELKRCDNNKSRAAKSLGIGGKTLYRKLEQYGETAEK